MLRSKPSSAAKVKPGAARPRRGLQCETHHVFGAVPALPCCR